MAGTFPEFHALVLNDLKLQSDLRRASQQNPDGFADAVVAAGSALGFEFGADEVSRAANTYRRAWIERWLD